MNGKRARERALARSQNNNRLAQKAASVERSEHERAFDRGMAELRKDRADAMKQADDVFEKALKVATDERKKTVKKADADYIEKRDALIKKLSRDQELAAA